MIHTGWRWLKHILKYRVRTRISNKYGASMSIILSSRRSPICFETRQPESSSQERVGGLRAAPGNHFCYQHILLPPTVVLSSLQSSQKSFPWSTSTQTSWENFFVPSLPFYSYLLLCLFSVLAVSVFSPVSFAPKGSQIPQNKDLTRLCLGNYHRKRTFF